MVFASLLSHVTAIPTAGWPPCYCCDPVLCRIIATDYSELWGRDSVVGTVGKRLYFDHMSNHKTQCVLQQGRVPNGSFCTQTLHRLQDTRRPSIGKQQPCLYRYLTHIRDTEGQRIKWQAGRSLRVPKSDTSNIQLSYVNM
jgi:hypothetical protein